MGKLRARASVQALLMSLILFLALVALVLVYQPQVNGYEVSLYSMVPVPAWICLIGAFCLTAGFFMFSALRSRESKATTWLSIAALYTISVIVLSLGAVRYGPMYGLFDNWNYLGYSQDAKVTGHVDLALDFYPQLHILTLILSEASYVGLEQVYKIVMPFLFSLRVPLTYMLARLLLKDRFSVVVATLLSAVNDFVGVGVFATPFTLSLVLVLWILFAVLRRLRSLASWFLLLPLVLSLAPTHILVSLIVSVSLIISALFERVLGGRRSKRAIDHPSKLFTVALGILVLICALGWLFYVTDIYATPVKMIFRAVTFTLTPQSAYLRESWQQHPSLTDPVMFSRLWLSPAIKVALSLLAIVLILRNVLLKRRVGELDLALLSGWIILLGLVYIFTEMFITGLAFSSERMIYAALMFLPIYAGYGMRMVLRKVERYHAISVIGVVALVGLCFASGLFVMYPSPYIQSSSSQTTEQQIVGTSWLVGRTRPPTQIWSGDEIAAIGAGLFGYDFVYREPLTLIRSYSFFQSKALLLTYLGYELGIDLSRPAGIDQAFIVIDPIAKELGVMGVRVTDKDIQMLHSDQSSNLIYASGEYLMYLHSEGRGNA
ncbi:hypothetical protein [[Eubacterium] cellulosolvens]